MADLSGKVALVTGASRGVGRGIALGVAEAGAAVYATGRTISAESFGATAHLIIPVRCDHTDDRQVEETFGRLLGEQGCLDVLVNNVWGGYERMVEGGEFTWAKPFWEQPLWRWDAMFAAGGGLIVNVSFWAARKYLGNVAYGVSKAATDKLTSDTAHELRGHDVAVVSLYPGLVRTEKVMESAAFLDLSNSESPQFVGRAVAALAADPDVMQKSGQVLVAVALAEEYGFADVDGRRPRPLTLEEL